MAAEVTPFKNAKQKTKAQLIAWSSGAYIGKSTA